MMIWVLRDYPLSPTFDGGSIHHVLPSLKLIEGLNQKGLFTYAGQAKPGVVSTVARLFAAHRGTYGSPRITAERAISGWGWRRR